MANAILPSRKVNSSQLMCTILRDGFKLSNGDYDDDSDIVSASQLKQRLDDRLSVGARARGQVTVALDRDRYIVRHLSELNLPMSQQKVMAEMDLIGSTPFQNSDVYLFPLTSYGARAGTAYALVKKSIFNPLQNELQSASLSVGEIQLLGQTETHYRVNGSALAAVSANTTKKAGVLALALGATAFIIAATFMHAYIRNATAIAALEDQNSILAKDAKEVRAIMDQRNARIAQLNSLRNQIEASTPVTEVWEELARALSDSSFLTDVSIKGQTISIVGYSAAASSLIGVLEGSTLFEKVEFSGAVVKVPGRDGDRFAINLQLSEK
jgi:general secretion pathway protein L